MTVIKDELRSLVGVRAFAAGLVVFWHFHLVLDVLAPGVLHPRAPVIAAFLAVDFFFMLSGFIMAEKYLHAMRRLSWEEARHFYTLRFARIWPVHVALVVAFVAFDRMSGAVLGGGVLGPDAARWTNTVLNVLMLHEVPPGVSINIPAWSVGVEVGAYLLFPFLALALVRFRSASSAFATAAIILVVGAWAYGQLFPQRDMFAVTLYVVPWVRIVFGFVAGALLNVGWRALRAGRYGPGWDVTAVMALAVIFTAIVVVNWSGPLALPVVAYPFIGLLVLACAGATGVVGRMLSSRPVEWCGRLSYSIYMTHYLVVIVLETVFIHTGADDLGLPVRLLLIGVSVLAVAATSVTSYYVLEEPARQWIRTWEHRRRQRRSAATTMDT